MGVVRAGNRYGMDVDLPISVLSLHVGNDGHVLVARVWATLVWKDGEPLP